MSTAFWIAIGFYLVSIVLLKIIFKVRRKHLLTMALWSMLAGIVFLCQPVSAFLFHYGIAVLFYGLLWWNIANNMKPEKIVQQ